MPGSIGPAVPEHRVPDRRRRDRRGRRRGRAGRALHPRPAGDEGLPQQPGGDRATRSTPTAGSTPATSARLDEDGSLWIVDRIKELIKYKGYQVAPAELEALLLTHPAITDAAVIAMPDEEAGEVPKAFVVTPGSITPEEVNAFVAERVAPYKRIRAVEIVDEIPKAPSGKILRRVLIERERTAAVAR